MPAVQQWENDIELLNRYLRDAEHHRSVAVKSMLEENISKAKEELREAWQKVEETT